MDLAASAAHMSPNKDIFSSFVELSKSKVIVVDNTKLQVKNSGTVIIPLLVDGKMRVVAAEDVFYVPRMSVNLLSVPKIAKEGFTIKFNRDACKILSGKSVIATTKSVDNIYRLSQSSNVKYSCKSNLDPTEWHRRLGHLNRISMKLLRDKDAHGLKFEDSNEQPCEICTKGKQAR